ncbi:PIN domain-containing protein [Candidatus Micrarchaeota archaeon]|nr:PIN domain-containing protein [Candidatus Micrarchaeota archaeon]
MKKYFFDTYALLELILGSPRYASIYSEVTEVITTDYNVAEAYYKMLSKNQPELAKKLEEMLLEDALIPSKMALIDACKVKLELRKTADKNISFVDALGYHMAKSMGLKFLTGDDAFKGLKNVEFVK